MPQPSIAYAVGRVRATARKALGAPQLERLLTAPSYEDALRALTEMGWGGLENANLEQTSTQMLEAACLKLRQITPDPDITDTFLLRHDAQNLKALLKARILGHNTPALSLCGTIPVDTLRHAVAERVYKRLPGPFAQVMEQLEKQTALAADPMLIDVRIDQALYSMIQSRMKRSTPKAVRDYFTGKADLQNAIAYLRLQAMKQAPAGILDVRLPGGLISDNDWQSITKHPEQLAKHLAAYPAAVKNAYARAALDAKAIPGLEKASDDYLLALFRDKRNEPFSLEVLIGWLLAHERETAAVRLILAGKLNDFPEEAIRERLREAYVQ